MLSLRLEGVSKAFPAARQAEGPSAWRRLEALWGSGVSRVAEGPPVPAEPVAALRGVDLFVPAGKTLSVLGPSGCGKTTLLRVIAGLEMPDSGRVFFGDYDVSDLPPSDRGIGMVFQDYALYPHMESKGNLAFYFRMHHREDEIEERVRVTSQLLGVGFAELLDKKPPTLSKGQQQRVAIGRCIVRDPSIFLFDEPMSNVDARVREQTRVTIKRLLHRFSVTSVYVTHDQTEAIVLGDLLAIMREGRIEQIGTYEEVFSRPANLFVAGFVGVPLMSFFPGSGEEAGLRLPGGVLVPLPSPLLEQVPVGERMTMGVRAQHVHLHDAVGGEGLLGVIEVVENLPSERQQLVYLKVGEVHCQALAPRDWPLKPGYVVRLEFDPNGIYLFAADGKRLWPVD